MPRALKVCSQVGCPELTTSGRCDACNHAAEQRRGSARQRGYGKAHEKRFRPQVLRRDLLCTCDQQCPDHAAVCPRQSTVADHWPLSRRELVDAGLDPNDPKHGRGLCKGCHDRHTSHAQPGGWHGSHSA